MATTLPAPVKAYAMSPVFSCSIPRIPRAPPVNHTQRRPSKLTLDCHPTHENEQSGATKPTESRPALLGGCENRLGPHPCSTSMRSDLCTITRILVSIIPARNQLEITERPHRITPLSARPKVRAGKVILLSFSWHCTATRPTRNIVDSQDAVSPPPDSRSNGAHGH